MFLRCARRVARHLLCSLTRFSCAAVLGSGRDSPLPRADLRHMGLNRRPRSRLDVPDRCARIGRSMSSRSQQAKFSIARSRRSPVLWAMVDPSRGRRSTCSAVFFRHPRTDERTQVCGPRAATMDPLCTISSRSEGPHMHHTAHLHDSRVMPLRSRPGIVRLADISTYLRACGRRPRHFLERPHVPAWTAAHAAAEHADHSVRHADERSRSLRSRYRIAAFLYLSARLPDTSRRDPGVYQFLVNRGHRRIV